MREGFWFRSLPEGKNGAEEKEAEREAPDWVLQSQELDRADGRSFFIRPAVPCKLSLACNVQGTSAWPWGLKAGEEARAAKNGHRSLGQLSPEYGSGHSAGDGHSGPGELVPWAGVDALPEESTAVGGRRREKGSRSARG